MLETATLTIACTKCGTRYRVDASRFAGRATNFKCTRCGNVFPLKVPQPSKDAPLPWTILRAGGGELAAPSVDTIKRLIMEGQVGPDDILSRGSSRGKRLGDIEQFAPFLRLQEHSGAFSHVSQGNGHPDEEEAAVAAELDVDVGEAAEAGAAGDEAGKAAPEPSSSSGGVDAAVEISDADAEALDARIEAASSTEAPERANKPAEISDADAEALDARIEAASALGEADALPASPPAPKKKKPTPPVRSSRAESGTKYASSVYSDALDTSDQIEVQRLSSPNRRLVLTSVILLLLGVAVALVAMYELAPDTFFRLFPFLAP